MKKEKMSAWKKLLILFLAILSVFAVINLVWLFGIEFRYDRYCKNLEKNEEYGRTTYSAVLDNYSYSVRKPGYMNFRGYLTVGDKEGYSITVDKDGNIKESSGLYIELDIIPNVLGRLRYRLWFCDDEQGLDAMVFIDSECNYIPSKTATEESKKATADLIAENIDEIKVLMNSAHEYWGL